MKRSSRSGVEARAAPRSRALPWLILSALAVLGHLTIGPRGARADQVSLEARIRDFSDRHPDFERYSGSEVGIVEDSLGGDDKPVFDTSRQARTVTSRESFDQWYRDLPGVNQGLDLELVLDNSLTGDPRVYSFDDSSFFPIDGRLLGNEGRIHNYHFTLEIHSRFTYQPGQFFRFRGDDDLWVFIDRRLVIDLGGVHGALESTVDLDQLGLNPDQEYDFALFFAERHTGQSNFRIDTSLRLIPTPTPSPSATPTPSATVTASPSATATLTPTSRPTPSPSATPTPKPRFLPLVLRERCPERWRPIDAILILDASTSMRASTARGRTKLEAAAEAAGAFLAVMRLEPAGDRAALVRFNEDGRALTALTADREALMAALATLESRPGSRIDMGLGSAAGLLAREGPPGPRRRVAVLLSDGLVNGAAAAGVEIEAERLRGAGVQVWSIGLGQEIDHGLLRAVAGSPWRYLEAPDAEALGEVYAGLAERLTCPPEELWGRR